LQQAAAWVGSNKLTPRGKQEYKEVLKGINYRDFSINLVDHRNDRWEFSVQRKFAGGKQTNLVTIPKVPTKGPYFGLCTCELPQHDAILCEHMTAVVVSSRVPVLTLLNIMPFWWTHVQWQVQSGKEVSAECFTNMEVIRAGFTPDEKMLLSVMECSKQSWSSAEEQM
jgi:hypothetical protein